MKFTEFITAFAGEAEEIIKTLVSEELDGDEKKAILDSRILEWALSKLKETKLNFVVKLVIEKLLKQYIKELTQIIYNLLKTKVKGL